MRADLHERAQLKVWRTGKGGREWVSDKSRCEQTWLSISRMIIYYCLIYYLNKIFGCLRGPGTDIDQEVMHANESKNYRGTTKVCLRRHWFIKKNDKWTKLKKGNFGMLLKIKIYVYSYKQLLLYKLLLFIAAKNIGTLFRHLNYEQFRV